MKSRMDGQNRIQPGDKTDLILLGIPIQGIGFMYVDLFPGKPFDAVGEAECTGNRSQSTERRPHFRVGGRGGRQTAIVMGLRVVNQKPVRGGLTPGIPEIAFHLFSRIVLEKLRIGPVHVRIVQQSGGDGGGAAQSFQEKDRFRILPANPGDNVFPCGFRDHVSGIAPEPVHAAGAPDQKDFCQVFPDFLLAVIQLHQVAPGDSPGAGRMKITVRFPHKPVRMLFLEFGSPARMVDGDIDEEPRVPRMDGICQFQELIQRGGFFVEFRQRRIHPREIQRGVRTAVPAHPGKRGGHRIHRQKMDDPAFQPSDDMVEPPYQAPERAGGRNQRVVQIVVHADLILRDAGGQSGLASGDIHSILTDEGTVNGIRAAIGGGRHVDVQIVPDDPDRFRILVGNQARLTLEMSFFVQCQTDGKRKVVFPNHGNVRPILTARRNTRLRPLDDLVPENRRTADVCAQKSRAGQLFVALQTNLYGVAAVSKQSFSRFGILN